MLEANVPCEFIVISWLFKWNILWPLKLNEKYWFFLFFSDQTDLIRLKNTRMPAVKKKCHSLHSPLSILVSEVISFTFPNCRWWRHLPFLQAGFPKNYEESLWFQEGAKKSYHEKTGDTLARKPGVVKPTTAKTLAVLLYINKQYPNQVVRFRNIFFDQNFTVIATALRSDFYLAPFGRYLGIKNGKNQETTKLSLHIASFFSVNRPNQKKTSCSTFSNSCNMCGQKYLRFRK